MHLGNSFSIVFEDFLQNQYTGLVYDVTKLEQREGFVYTIIYRIILARCLRKARFSADLRYTGSAACAEKQHSDYRQ